MKKQLVYIVLMVFGSAGLFSCSQNNLAQNKSQEYDDLYYTSADRKAVIEAQPIAHRASATGYSDQNFRQNGQLAYEEENFSARKVNPEYISRYNATEDDTILEEQYDDSEYFVEGYDQQTRTNNMSNVRHSNYYGGGFNNFGFSPFYSPFMMGGFYDPFMWDPFWGPRFMRPGITVGFGMSFGWGMGMYDPFWGRGFYNPYRMGMFGMYDPFWGGFYSPWGMNSYHMGYNRGFYNGMAFNRYYMDGYSPIRNTRTVVSGPRMSRGTIAGTTGTGRRASDLTRATASNTQTSRTTARASSDLQNNYYSRARRSVTEQQVSRSAAESTRRSIDGTAYTRHNEVSRTAGQRGAEARTAPAGTEYNRSTTPARSPQYRNTTPSSGTNHRTAPGTPSRSTQPQYRSTPSAPRSTQPQYRSTPSTPSRSGGYSPSPSSSPSRSGGSYSPSSSPSRSSAPSGGGAPARRGGR